MKKAKTNMPTLKTPLYGNCRVEDPAGLHIFNASMKKCRWYLRKELADVINKEPFTIRLTFVPKGGGRKFDPFYLQKRENICVCCGSIQSITRHHIVPIMYRKWFDDEIKDHSSHDILPVCYSCHEKYETFADAFKAELLKEVGIDTGKPYAMVLDTALKKVCLYATALLKHREAIPADRYNNMMGVIREHYGKQEITDDDLVNASKVEYNTRRIDYVPEGKLVVDAIGDIEVFIRRWRNHFLTFTEAKYMPKYWDVNRPIDRTNGG